MARIAAASALLFVLATQFLFTLVKAGEGEPFYNARGQKSYEEEEEGKLLPSRTFLTTLEIALICIFVFLGFFLLVGLVIYLYCFGCVCPPCCKRKKKDYTQVQLQRERKIGEIWKQNYHA